MAGYSRDPVFSLHLCHNAVFPHKPGDSVLSAGYTPGLQIFCNARAAIGLPAFLIDPDDMVCKFRVLFIPLTCRPYLPRIIAAFRYIEYNEPVFHFGCFEKMANAFFNISLSSLISASSRFKRRSSSSSGFKRPLPGKALCVS